MNAAGEFFSQIKTRISAVVVEAASAISPHLERKRYGTDVSEQKNSELGKTSKDKTTQPHINNIFENPELTPQKRTNSLDLDSESDEQPAPPNTSQLRTRSIVEPREPLMEKSRPTSGSKPPISRRMSNIDMIVHNEEGEAEEVEIDVTDQEVEHVAPLTKVECKKQTIADRINRRRHSEVAADILRMSAAHRRREFAELVDEHNSIVRELEKYRYTQPSQAHPIHPIRESGERNKENSSPGGRHQ